MKQIRTLRAELFLFILFVMGSLNARGQEKLILFGGGGYTPTAVQKFVEWAGGRDAKILIVPWATDNPDYEFDEVKEVLSPHKTSKVVKGLSPDEKGFNKSELLTQIDEATGIFFPGGDQVDLMERINRNPEVRQSFLNAYHRGIVIAGFSAGTAMASKTMITGHGDFTQIAPKNVETAEGLGLVTEFVVDQHFIARQRQNRLISVLQVSRENFGLGIDEKMALIVEDGLRTTALGPSYVMVFHRLNSSKKFKITLLQNGETLTIPSKPQ